MSHHFFRTRMKLHNSCAMPRLIGLGARSELMVHVALPLADGAALPVRYLPVSNPRHRPVADQAGDEAGRREHQVEHDAHEHWCRDLRDHGREPHPGTVDGAEPRRHQEPGDQQAHAQPRGDPGRRHVSRAATEPGRAGERSADQEPEFPALRRRSVELEFRLQFPLSFHSGCPSFRAGTARAPGRSR